MAGSTGNNSVNTSDGPDGLASMGNDTAFEDMPKEMLKLFKEAEAYVDRISKAWKEAIDETSKATGAMGKDKPGSGRLGLGSFTRAEKMQGLGLGVMAVGSAYMSMAPNTMAAVSQRIGADTYAGISGMSSRQAIMQANSQVGGGATSAMGATMAAMNLYSMGGYTANSLSSKNIMGQLAGMSAMTGMSNEQAAASVAGINGMNFLRMGVRVRDAKGNLRPTDQIVNAVFKSLTRGGKITPEQAAAGFLNPGGKGYATLQAITGGDQALMATLQSGIMARAKAGSDSKFSAAMNSKDPNKMLDTLGVDKSSPLRANFRYNTSEAKKLQATEQGLVGGYDASLRTTAALNDAYSKMAELLGPVNQGLMTLKGILQTFPNTGGMGATVSNLANTGVGMAAHGMQLKMMGNFLKGAPTAAAETEAAAGLSAAGAATVAGTGLAAGAVGYGVGKGGKALGKKLGIKNKAVVRGGSALAAAGAGAATGAGIGAMFAPETLGLSIIAGSIIGGIAGFFGSGGEAPSTMNLGTGVDHSTHHSGKAHLTPVPHGTPVTSHFGPRPKAAARAAAHGQHISSNHKGTDFGVSSGTTITSAGDGVVVEIGNQAAGWGNYVLIQHADGTKTRYAHLRQIGVSRNQKIKAGQAIGRSGGGPTDPGRGNANAAHLHFEAINQAGVAVNPEKYLSGAGPQPTPAPVPESSPATIKNFISNSKGSTFKPRSIDDLSSANINTLIDADGRPISWSSLSKKYKGSDLNSILNSVPDAYTGPVTSNKKDLIKTIARHGFHGDALKTAYAISIAESGGRSNARGDIKLQDSKWGPSIGLFQIRSLKNWKAYNDQYRDATRLPNPDFNATAAFIKSNQGKNFKAWSTYTSGSFLKHLGEADSMAHSAGVGGEGSTGLNLPSHMGGSSSGHSGRGSVSLNSNASVVINLNMDVKIAHGSVQEADRLVKMVGQKLKNDAVLKQIAGAL